MRKPLLLLFLLTLSLMFSLIPSSHAASGLYYFQVGAQMSGSIDATGASVEIQVKSPQEVLDRKATLAYWVGLNLPGDSFIQVGYGIGGGESAPSWFWEYFVPGTAAENAGKFLGQVGNGIGPNGTWYKFSLTAQGTAWSASVNGHIVGSVDLGASSSAGNTPSAIAEVAGASTNHNVLGPVAFRNLEYRDLSNQWHVVERADYVCCFGAGSATTFAGSFSYSVQSIQGENNTWIAGSNLEFPIQSYSPSLWPSLWPWYRVTISSSLSNVSEWRTYGDVVDLSDLSKELPNVTIISNTTRYYFEGWYVNGELQKDNFFRVMADTDVKPAYLAQYFVNVASPRGQTAGSGWYDAGSNATVSVNPTVIMATGILGMLGVSFRMVGWSGASTEPEPGMNGAASVQVHSPMTLTAVWRTDYGLLPFLALIVTIAIVALVYLFRPKRR